MAGRLSRLREGSGSRLHPEFVRSKNFWYKRIFFVQKHYLEPSAERFWKRKPSIPGSFVRDIGVLETDFQKMVILRRRNGHPETEGIKNEHLASTKRSFVICTLAQLAGFVPFVELPKMVN